VYLKEVLSQSEIDMLLNALTSGELTADEVRTQVAKPKVKVYDFRRPNKFSQDHLRTLSMIHENFGRLVSNFLSAYLRTSVQVKISSVDQLTYEDFVVSIPTPTMMTVFTMSPLPGRVVMESNAAFIFPLIDLLFGGTGEMPRRVRELTEIELNVLRNLNARLLENMTYIWSDIYQLKPKIEALETNPQLSQAIAPNETVAIITFATNIGKVQGLLNICLPYMTLEPLVSRLSTRQWLAMGESGVNENYHRRLHHLLGTAMVKFAVEVGETDLSVRDFLQLGVGDVITLDNVMGADMVMTIEDRPKFYVQPGMMGKKMAVQVTGLVERGNKE